MNDHLTDPAVIAIHSFAIIREELKARGCSIEPPLGTVIERVIHSTADFEFADIIRSSPDAVEAGIRALKTGCTIVTDVQMVRVGIDERRLTTLGGSLHCFVADDQTRQRAAAAGISRSAAGMRSAAELGLLTNAIVAIGNAPTALYEVLRLIDEKICPILIVGVPVGFVGAAESKAALMQIATVPWLATQGRKGGSPVATAIINALLRLATDSPAAEV